MHSQLWPLDRGTRTCRKHGCPVQHQQQLLPFYPSSTVLTSWGMRNQHADDKLESAK